MNLTALHQKVVGNGVTRRPNLGLDTNFAASPEFIDPVDYPAGCLAAKPGVVRKVL